MCANIMAVLTEKNSNGEKNKMGDTDDRINRIETKIDAITEKINSLQTVQEVTKQLAKHRNNDVKVVLAVSYIVNGFLVLFVSLHLI